MPKTILIVDDSAAIRKFVSLALKIKGYDIILAEDGMDALEALPSHQIDLLITDLNMPQIDGLSLIKNIREDDEYKDLPIIILTSLTADRYIEEGIKAGANSFLPKPFNIEKIQNEVSKYLDIKGK